MSEGSIQIFNDISQVPQQVRRGAGCIRDYFRDIYREKACVTLLIDEGEVKTVILDISDNLQLDLDFDQLLEEAEVVEQAPKQQSFDPEVVKQPEHPAPK